jgi:hypothetical protein
MEPKPQSDAMEYPGYLHVVVEGEKFFFELSWHGFHHVMDTNAFIMTTNVQLEGEC